MNLPRIRELQDFTDEFRDKINSAIERYNTNQNDIKNPTKTSPLHFSPPKKIKLKKLAFSQDIFKESPPWKNPKHYGHFFDKFKILRPEHDPSSIELYRVNLVKRSYEKPSNMLSGKDFVCRNLFPQDINNPLKDNRSFHNLSPLGRNIMEKFVKDNDKKEKELRLKDIEYNEYLHSKKKGTENVWKCPKAHGEFFSVPNGDVVTSYKKDKRPKRLIDIPFRIPRANGTFFDKDIKPL